MEFGMIIRGTPKSISSMVLQGISDKKLEGVRPQQGLNLGISYDLDMG